MDPMRANQTVIEAMQFAKKKHNGQMYGSLLPYTAHLEDVYDLACEYKLSAEIQAAAWLHDILEDTNVSPVELRIFFGYYIAGLVDGVTNRPGFNRDARLKETLPRIRASRDTVALKLCDRIANARACRRGDRSLFRMYQTEYPMLREALYREDDGETIEAMWAELDALMEDITS